MPTIRPFRALRYSPEVVPDLAAVVAPPYDVIDAEARRRLVARDPRNVVRLDLPEDEPGDPPDERYRRAAHVLSAWRSDGTLRRDPRPSLYPYEQVYTVPGTERRITRRGVFARVRLEPFGRNAGIRAHERTLSEPKEDRYRVLRATGVNTSPVVGMYEDGTGRAADLLGDLTAAPSIETVVDDDGVEHRLWVVPVGEAVDGRSPVAELCELIGRAPITLADGHHRYETALRYATERRRGPVIEDDPAWAEILMLLLEPIAGPLTVLATHRVLLGLGEPVVDAMLAGLPDLFAVRTGVGAHDLVAEFGAGDRPGGRGRFGLWTRRGGAILTARRDVLERWLPPGGPALRRLDVTIAGVAIERLMGLDAEALADGGRIAYTRDAREAIGWVAGAAAPTSAGGDGTSTASAALLLEPTPASDIVAVAADGDVMPQKSTYIYPKALTGLVINPLE